MAENFEIIHKEKLIILSNESRNNPRKRINYNLHKDLSDPYQRLLNAIEPGSYLRPHRHSKPAKAESIFILQGSVRIFLFSEKGTIEHTFVLSQNSGNLGIDIQPGVWHSLISIESGSVIFEAKMGPYSPLDPVDLAPWAPAENDPAAMEYLENLKLFPEI